jgi:ABC-2 type transport system permease protein
MPRLANIHRLGIKELWSLARDPIMLVLIIHTFSLAIYISGTVMPETLNKAPLAIVDEDGSPLSARIAADRKPPRFKPPVLISPADMDAGLDAGDYTFVLDIPPGFQRDVLAGKSPALQLNVDATRMSQAFTGSSYIQQMITGEVTEFVQRYRGSAVLPVELAMRARFNPNLQEGWFGSFMELINNVTMLSIILTGAALIREREHGTIEHLLVMPVIPAEIDGVGGAGLYRPVPGARDPWLASGAHRRLHRLVFSRRHLTSVRDDLARHIHGHDRAFDAAIRNARRADPAADAVALRQLHAARKYA